MNISATQLAVIGGIFFLVGVASWQFIGTFLVWAAWQLVLYYAILAVVGALLYWGLATAARHRDE